MSSILDALRELEASRAAGRPAPDGGPAASAQGGLFAAAVVASVVGAVVAVLVIRNALIADRPVEVATIEVAPETDGAPPPVAAIDATAASAAAEPPRARVVRAMGALVSATPSATVRPARRPTARDAAAPVVEQAARPGEPRVRMTGLHYADDPASRRITVGIGGSAPVTLGEGDAAEGVEVSLILPDRAYLRHAGNIFTVRPER